MDIFENYDFCGYDETEVNQIIQQGEVIEVKKGERIFESKICDKMGVVFEGILYSYSIDDKGEKKISQFFFYPKNYIVVDYISYSQNSISNLNIEAIEKSKLLVFKRKTVNQLYEKYPKLVQTQREMARQMYINSLALISIFQTTNAEERIKILKENVPELFKKVPYAYIASFLGIHRNTFNAALKKL